MIRNSGQDTYASTTDWEGISPDTTNLLRVRFVSRVFVLRLQNGHRISKTASSIKIASGTEHERTYHLKVEDILHPFGSSRSEF